MRFLTGTALFSRPDGGSPCPEGARNLPSAEGPRGEFAPLFSHDDKVGSCVITSKSTNIAKDVDEKGGGITGESLLGNQLLVSDSALDEVPLTIFPCTPGGGEVNPGFRDFVLTLKRGPGNAA